MESLTWSCVLVVQELRMPSGPPSSWRGCQPTGTSEKGREVAVLAERPTLWVLFHLTGLLALGPLKGASV